MTAREPQPTDPGYDAYVEQRESEAGHQPCDTCHGEGVVEESVGAPWNTREVVCGDCGGSGCAPECEDFMLEDAR